MNRESNKSDFDLIGAFNAGDTSAFDTLVIRHQDRVFNICYRMLGDYDEADDCAQETFIKLYRSLKGFRYRSAFSTWLYRVTMNTCKNRLSSSGYRRRRSMASIDRAERTDRADRTGNEGEGGMSLQIGDESQTPNGVYERKELEETIQSAIESLPGDQRTIIVLRDVEGLSYEDIVAVTGLHMGTLKSKIHRARQRLKEQLEGRI
jgi:RNA polymerase sigma-70 factor (ECF subfamily)